MFSEVTSPLPSPSEVYKHTQIMSNLTETVINGIQQVRMGNNA